MNDAKQTLRDHFLSVYQSAAADYASKLADEESAAAGAAASETFMSAANDVASLRSRDQSEMAVVEEGVADIPKMCARLGFRYLEALVSGDQARARCIKEHLTGGTCDPVAHAGILLRVKRHVPFISQAGHIYSRTRRCRSRNYARWATEGSGGQFRQHRARRKLLGHCLQQAFGTAISAQPERTHRGEPHGTGATTARRAHTAF
ncbi:hypothetical protein IVA88_24985 [Bradyrhizobium sp. 149]|uniref:hypothetical protein n=1 Tax=Bradyrhizobium sp. 149 TaxID=2782624 RepID=UPI001FF8A41A|nr:hypothetical protein [Bradyrhizobium sp. 149]MCK1654676.1 hypothetical protein [Bradyrhizobium sp. 149]